MSLFKIAWRSIQQRALASGLTALSMALGVALVICVLVIHGALNRSFTQGTEGYNVIVGAKGWPLQLVLNTVYHLSKPVENIPYSYYKRFKPGGDYARYIDKAIPFCLGDSYQGKEGGYNYRVVGTVGELFQTGEDENAPMEEYAPGRKYKFAEGRNFHHDGFFEAVIGSIVAERTGLKVGDGFQPTHGVVDDDQGHKHDAFTVVGILAPTGTPNDRALFVNIEGFYKIPNHRKPVEPGKEKDAHAKEGPDHDKHEHDKEKDPASATVGAAKAKEVKDKDADHDHEHDKAKAPVSAKGKDADHDHHGHDEHDNVPVPEAEREVTAILLRSRPEPRMLMSFIGLTNAINEGLEAQAVSPTAEIYQLFDSLVGPMRIVLLTLAALIVVVAGIGIMVSIYNSMSDRRREIAIMRSLGASRSIVLAVVLLESILLSLGGGVAGCLLGHGIIGGLSPWITSRTGVAIGFLQFDGFEVVLIPGLMILATLVGFLPALAAYRTDVSKALTSSH
jgi:putative ABC transport system permease protein